jgi:hypothetical protein
MNLPDKRIVYFSMEIALDRHPDSFVEIMRYTIALNGSFFNTQRMVTQYVAKAYFA